MCKTDNPGLEILLQLNALLDPSNNMIERGNKVADQREKYCATIKHK